MLHNIKKLFESKEEEKKELKFNKFQLFLDLVNSYLKREYPNITFDLSLYENNEEEDNLKVQKAMLIYEVIRQFADFKWEVLSMNEQQFEDYKSKYLDLYDKVKSDGKVCYIATKNGIVCLKSELL